MPNEDYINTLIKYFQKQPNGRIIDIHTDKQIEGIKYLIREKLDIGNGFAVSFNSKYNRVKCIKVNAEDFYE